MAIYLNKLGGVEEVEGVELEGVKYKFHDPAVKYLVKTRNVENGLYGNNYQSASLTSKGEREFEVEVKDGYIILKLKLSFLKKLGLKIKEFWQKNIARKK